MQARVFYVLQELRTANNVLAEELVKARSGSDQVRVASAECRAGVLAPAR